MVVKVPVSVKAAAELELRRRQKERANNCYRCGSRFSGPLEKCDHTRDEQDINSERNQRYIAQVNLIYGTADAN